MAGLVAKGKEDGGEDLGLGCWRKARGHDIGLCRKWPKVGVVALHKRMVVGCHGLLRRMGKGLRHGVLSRPRLPRPGHGGSGSLILVERHGLIIRVRE